MRSRTVTSAAIAALILVALLALVIKARGFRASSTPSAFETSAARLVRDFAIPRAEKRRKNPFAGDEEALGRGRDQFLSHCSTCHGSDGRGATPIGANEYPRAPDLRGPATQGLTDGEIRYIIANGIQATGMPAMPPLNGQEEYVSWALVTYLRSLHSATPAEAAHQQSIVTAAQYVGSQACERCHTAIYERWKRTPMANVVRDPREHPDAIIPDLRTNKVAPFTLDQVAFVYGSKWKQRYFTSVGDDYFPLPAQWDVGNKTWRPYHVADTGTDWWAAYYPAGNLERPTGPPCDGCHSVNYDIRDEEAVAEWNVGCETLPRPRQRSRRAVLAREHRQSGAARCHRRERHLHPVPFAGTAAAATRSTGKVLRLAGRVPRRLATCRTSGSSEPHTLGETTFTHFADGTAHKNRMQGNDFVQSVMYRRGVTCASAAMTCTARGTMRSFESRRQRSASTVTHRTARTVRMSPGSNSIPITRPAAQAANASPVTCRKSPPRACPVRSSAHTHSAL